MRKVLESSTTIALVGASSKPERPSNYVMEFLLQQGYDVYPVNPGQAGKQIHGRTVFPSIRAVADELESQKSGSTIDIVDVFRRSEDVGGVVDEAIDTKAKAVWMQVGVINIEAAKKARKVGNMEVVMNACPYETIPRLGIKGPSFRTASSSNI